MRKLKYKIIKFLHIDTLSKRKKSDIKERIKLFFEGKVGEIIEKEIKPIIDIPIDNLGITDIKMYAILDHIYIDITSTKPGLVIGKQGYVIGRLSNYIACTLNKNVKVKINVIESKIWK